MSGEPIEMYDGHAAINVKYYGPYPEGASESDIEAVRRDWWEQAAELAHERGYSGVFAEGRSGGWLIPYRQRIGGKVAKHYYFPGQGGHLGYPTYPDVEHDGAERERFRAFERRIQRLLADVPEMLRDCAAQIEADASEAASNS